MPSGCTFNKKYYKKVKQRLYEEICFKQSELWNKNSWLLHHDNTPTYRLCVKSLGQPLLVWLNVTVDHEGLRLTEEAILRLSFLFPNAWNSSDSLFSFLQKTESVALQQHLKYVYRSILVHDFLSKSNLFVP